MESERNLMNTTEAARYLGVKPSYLYKMMMRRAVPYYKPGGKLCFFAKEDLDTWLKRARALGYRPRRRLSEVELDGLRQLAACRTDMINFANALHGLTDDEKVRLFRHRPTMLEWYEKVAAVTDRVTDFLQSAQSANNYPAGTTDRPDKEDDA